MSFNTMAFIDNDPKSFLAFHPYGEEKMLSTTPREYALTTNKNDASSNNRSNNKRSFFHELFRFERNVLKQLILLGRKWNNLVTPDWKRRLDNQRELIKQAHQRSITRFRIQSEVVQEWKHKMGKKKKNNNNNNNKTFKQTFVLLFSILI